MAQDPDEPPPPPVERTGPIGRLVRLLMAAGLFLALAYPLASLPRLFDPALASEPMLWILTGISLLAIPYVLDVGLAWGHGQRIQLLAVGIGLALLVSNLVLYDSLWGPVLAIFVLALQTWVLGALALGYLLAAILGTPGCELRSYQHLASLVSDKAAEPTFCAAGLDSLDAWEAGRRSG